MTNSLSQQGHSAAVAKMSINITKL